MNGYVRPASLDDALARLSERPHRILAGGTDVYPADAAAAGWGKPGIGHPDNPPMLDIGGLDALRGIHRLADRTEIGALVTWTEAIGCALPAWFDCMRMAAREVGGRQIQNRGTLAGNLCNASPAADGVPPLLVVNARVRLRQRGGSREIPLRDFITGNRRTRLHAGELMTAIVIPSPAPGARSTFLKLGARRYLVISIAMTAACLELKDGRIRDARVAVGACSEIAQRLPRLEARLENAPACEAPDMVREEDFAALSPLDDVRASASYRRHGARILVRRALDALIRTQGTTFEAAPRTGEASSTALPGASPPGALHPSQHDHFTLTGQMTSPVRLNRVHRPRTTG